MYVIMHACSLRVCLYKFVFDLVTIRYNACLLGIVH
jgi:hypothetical protein